MFYYTKSLIVQYQCTAIFDFYSFVYASFCAMVGI